jgi:hypothetical protein
MRTAAIVHTKHGDAGLGWLFLVGFAAVVTYDAAGPRFLPGQKELQAAFLIGVILIAFGATLFGKLGRIGRLEFYGLAALTLFFVPIPLQRMIELRWIVGDYLLLAAPLAVLALVRLSPGLLQGRQYAFILMLLALAAMMAPLFADQDDRFRFEAPSLLLMSSAWVAFFYARSLALKGLLAVGLVALLILSWFSQWRGAVAAFVLLPPVVLVMLERSKLRFVVVVLVIMLVSALLALLARDWLLDLLMTSRFAGVLARGVESDESLLFRFIEARDVLAVISNDWSALNYVLGGGFGASFKANMVYSAMTERYAQGNVVAGRVHNIHLGPLMILFRFGFLGMAILLWIWWLVLRDVLRLMSASVKVEPVLVAMVAATLMSLLLFNLYNVTNQAVFPVMFGLYLAARERWRVYFPHARFRLTRHV